jgi:hypothetical protein
MKEGARVHHSYGSCAPSTYGSYEPREANPSTAHRQGITELLVGSFCLQELADGHLGRGL